MPSGRRREHAHYVASLKIYFRPLLTAVASRILKSLLSKQNTEASLASLSLLVPGDDRVVRHICIRCIRRISAVMNSMQGIKFEGN